MSGDLHNVLVGLVTMDHDERRESFAEHPEVLFGQQVVGYIQEQLSQAVTDASAITADQQHWSKVPDFIVETFAAGARQWAEGVDGVWNDMVAYAQEVTAQPSPAPTPTPAPSPRPGRASISGRGQVPGVFTSTAPTEDEILQDHLDHVRVEQENFQNDLDYHRVTDDAIDYSTPSYDSYSYDSYDPY